ncbi:AAA family ATPase [uncultured Xanthomonas sp.]|uniref:AAA family ATPase n=1 Tax=uncultured Xanthomonas sp. TaxID=152831 RepID=UPI0026009849|nr:AAA family ATPase [uncultured Xanthomonas sp.]
MEAGLGAQSAEELKIVYAGNDGALGRAALAKHPNVIVLDFDRWDDFNFKTTLPTRCLLKGQPVDLGTIQILVQGQESTHPYLAALKKKGWDGYFPIPDTDYISVPAALTFYEQIVGHLSLHAARQAAEQLRDASLLVKDREDARAIALTNTTGFSKSLQRESGAIRAFAEAWRILTDQDVVLNDQEFIFTSARGDLLTLHLRHKAPVPLPYDINLLIGPNGTGKSQLLHQIVGDWLDIDRANKAIRKGHFKESPKFSKLVVVSYSPFELFPVDLADSPRRKDEDDYRYFGLRGRRTQEGARTRSSRAKIQLSRAFPSADAADSLLRCLSDDHKFSAIRDWSRKIQTAYNILENAIDFDYMAVALAASAPDSTLKDAFKPHNGFLSRSTSEGVTFQLVPIDQHFHQALDPAQMRALLLEKEGVFFVKGTNVVELSSGQRLFSYIVINILGAIRRNSFIIIDEPELFLHPNLEIAFLGMLKSILKAYDSKALIATHSLVTVREIPSDCVHVLEHTSEGVIIKKPPFETFGGDIQRISSYVFGDRSVTKPFEDWIRVEIKKHGGSEQLLAALGDDLNEEMIIQINAMGKGAW